MYACMSVNGINITPYYLIYLQKYGIIFIYE